LSVKQLDADNIEKFREILCALEFPIHHLELEVTESLIMHHESLAELHKLDALGIRIAMDDFGTGHSSLAQLKHLPISKLKIDRSFIKDLSEDENDRIIAKTIIAMGHSLGLIVIAEGVETVEQQAFLAQEGCDLIQGYLLSRPLTVEQFSDLFKVV
jgi:EAL domain-containing protein (putative c-di-GMP-specific phosphodiesterase class I)